MTKALARYKEKRHFKTTPEPGGVVHQRNGALHFVVHKHAASHLHYDLRLEMEGVLKSWAVPKGPSLNPDDKRLAVEVEDHPYDYLEFEGNIPEGNYGAGNVIVWDTGTYEAPSPSPQYCGGQAPRPKKKKGAESFLLEGLEKGHISFVLHGKKLRGEYSLVKMRGRGKNAWLLIKKKDNFSTREDILKKNKSVISGIKVEDIPSETIAKVGNPASAGRVNHLRINRAHLLPETNVLPWNEKTKPQPMLAYLTPKPFDGRDWIYEIKYDGYRAMAILDGESKVSLYSRNLVSFNTRYKAIIDGLKKINHSAVLDGEIVVEDNSGRSHFQLLQRYRKSGKGNLKYYVFDILALDGRNLQHLTLLQRKELLKMLLAKYRLKNIFYSDHVEAKGKEFYQLAVKHRLEGVMAKKANSPYREGRRSRDWLKIKITNDVEAVIGGITEPAGSRKHFGSVLLGQYREGELIYIGNCGTGFSEKSLKELYEKFKPAFTEKSPFKEKIKGFGKIQWIEPRFVGQVKFTERTQAGILRHPVFHGIRTDKEAREVTVEPMVNPGNSTTRHSHKPTNGEKKSMNGKEPKPDTIVREDKPAGDYDFKIGKVILHLTNQYKIFFPEDHISKGDIVNYYNEISDIILPYLKDRPQSLLRFPNGIHKDSFFQKDIDVDKAPAWLKTQKIFSESNRKYIHYLLCNDKATLIYMANLGCIDINPWNSTVNNPENPDWAIIDLDPEKIDFKAVVKTALTVKEVMDELEVDCYCKTSGATGMHIYIPLGGKYDYDTVKNFTQLVAHTVQVRIPEITSIERLPKKRQHKVYIDFLQNRRGQTLAAPYSIRAKMGAPVSTPLEWKELNEKLNPLDFNMKNIFKRLEKKGDLWKPVLGKGVNLNALLKKMGEVNKDKSR